MLLLTTTSILESTGLIWRLPKYSRLFASVAGLSEPWGVGVRGDDPLPLYFGICVNPISIRESLIILTTSQLHSPLDFQTFLWPYVILCIGIQSFMKYINSSTLFFDALFLQETYLTFNVQQLINILLKHENENSTSETISIHLEPAGLAS